MLYYIILFYSILYLRWYQHISNTWIKYRVQGHKGSAKSPVTGWPDGCTQQVTRVTRSPQKLKKRQPESSTRVSNDSNMFSECFRMFSNMTDKYIQIRSISCKKRNMMPPQFGREPTIDCPRPCPEVHDAWHCGGRRVDIFHVNQIYIYISKTQTGLRKGFIMFYLSVQKMWAHLRITGLSWRPISLEFRGQAQALGQTLPLLWTRTRMAPVISLTPDSRNHGPIKKLNRSFYSFCSIYIDGFPCPVFPHPPSPPNGMVPILHIQGSS